MANRWKYMGHEIGVCHLLLFDSFNETFSLRDGSPPTPNLLKDSSFVLRNTNGKVMVNMHVYLNITNDEPLNICMETKKMFMMFEINENLLWIMKQAFGTNDSFICLFLKVTKRRIWSSFVVVGLELKMYRLRLFQQFKQIKVFGVVKVFSLVMKMEMLPMIISKKLFCLTFPRSFSSFN